MTTSEFIKKIVNPHVTVLLDEKCLLDSDVSITYEKFSRDKIGDLQAPWYVLDDGRACAYNEKGATPIKINEALNKLDQSDGGHKNHIEGINFFKKELEREKLLVYAPILPVVGFNGDKTYIVFDGNHRLIASNCIAEIEDVLIMVVKSKNMKNISFDFMYH